MENNNLKKEMEITNEAMTFDEMVESMDQAAKQDEQNLAKSGFGVFLKKREVIDKIKGFLSVDTTINDCDLIKTAVPPGSMLEQVLSVCQQTTSIPHEIPFYVVQHYLAGYLLKKGVTYTFAGKKHSPDIWTIVLAESGNGKTFIQSVMKAAIGNSAVDLFPNPASSAAFMEALQTHNNALWVRDEFAQMLDAMEKQSYMTEMKDYLLKLYDNDNVSRITKGDPIEIENPRLSILGTTVFSTFKNKVTEEMLLDGFAQRFSYAVAKEDPSRPHTKFPIMRTHEAQYINRIQSEWNKIMSMKIHSNYNISANAFEAFESSYRFLAKDQGALENSFFRRVMFSGSKYALLYHILLNKESDVLDEVDFSWAGRVCALQIQDVKRVLSHYNSSALEHNVKLVEGVMRKFKAEGKVAQPRDIVHRVRAIKTVSEAKHLMSIARI